MVFAKRLIYVILVILLLSHTPALFSEEAPELLSRADSLYDNYDYQGSVKTYNEAIKLDTLNSEAYWKLSRSLSIVGELAPKDSQLAIFESARDAANRAILLGNIRADVHFQLARALGKIALFKGIFKSASLAKQVKKEAEIALSIDSLHDGACHILGRWHREVGKKPKIVRAPMGLGAANKEDAFKYMTMAVRINPNLIHHRLEMGITYEEYGYNDEAIKEFKNCLSIEPKSPLDFKYVREAENLLAELLKK